MAARKKLVLRIAEREAKARAGVLPLRERICIAMQKISAQFDTENPYARLMLAVINGAVQDIASIRSSKVDRELAERYLQWPVHAELCGVDPAWVRDVFKRYGVIGG